MLIGVKVVFVVGLIGYGIVVILYIVLYVIGVVFGFVGDDDLEDKDYVKVFLFFFIFLFDFVVMVDFVDVVVKGNIFKVYIIYLM